VLIEWFFFPSRCFICNLMTSSGAPNTEQILRHSNQLGAKSEMATTGPTGLSGHHTPNVIVRSTSCFDRPSGKPGRRPQAISR